MNKILVGSAVVLALVAYSAEAQWTRVGSNTYVTNTGDNVGIGTTAPVVKLDVGGWTGKPGDVIGALTNFGGVGGGDVFVGNTGAGVGRLRFGSNANVGFMQWNMYYNGSGYKSVDTSKPSFEIGLNGIGNQISFTRYAPSAGALAAQSLMTISGSGRVGIGTTAPTAALHVVGAVFATGTISGGNVSAHYQDLAEWVPASAQLEPGTVVVLNKEKTNEVMASAAAYDTSVAGVVSAQPGVILGLPGEDKEMIATTGRVKVRVDATAAPIAIGDLLVTSETPGMAMKSTPFDLGGRTFHQPGTIIGKALEPLASGKGEILVLLSMQ